MFRQNRRLSGLVGLAGILAAVLIIGAPVSATAAPVITDLGGLPGSELNIASGINDSGTIVGMSASHAVRWNQDGTVTDLGVLPGDTRATASKINSERGA